MKNTNEYFPLLPNRATSRKTLFWLILANVLLAALYLRLAASITYPAPQAVVVPNRLASAKSLASKGVVEASSAKANEMLEGTPMEGLGDLVIEKATEYDVNWTLIIGIAEAESSRGKNMVHPYDYYCYNAWGIKPPKGQRDDGSYLRCYYDWKAGITTIAAILSRRYKDQTPEQMCGVYVQPCTKHWLRNVHKFYQANP